MKNPVVLFDATFFVGATCLLASTGSAQSSGSSAYAEAGAICCTVQAGADVQGSQHLTTNPQSSAAASFASPGSGISHAVLSNASAYADLATGKIGAASYSTNYGYTRAYGKFEDVLTFNIPGAISSTITPITFNLIHHGTIDPSYGLVNSALFLSIFQSNVNNSNGVVMIERSKGSGNDAEKFYSRVQKSGWLNFSQSVGDQGDTYSVTATYGLLGSSPILRLSEYLSMYTWQEAYADFSHTASLNLAVPDGTTFTSASRIFLSDVSSAVPEPGSWLMMIAGFGTIGATIRRRSQKILHI